MKAVENNDDWYLFDPYEVEKVTGHDLSSLWGNSFEVIYQDLIDNYVEGKDPLKLVRKINAKDFYKKIMKVQLETGLPYIAFKDTINRANPNKEYGYIPGVNLCCESFSVVDAHNYSHCCNLLSLNLANILTTENIEAYTELGVRILDNTIDLTNAPIPSTEKHNTLFRTIGLGSMGLADHLAINGRSYQDLDFIDLLFEDIAYYTVRASVSLAALRGTFDAYPESSWAKGELINCKSLEEITDISYNPQRWVELADLIQEFGIRNSQLLAIAPNTSTSLVQDCTASVLPAFSSFFINRGNGSHPIAPPYSHVKTATYEYNNRTSQDVVVKAMSRIAKWTDTGISMELLFNLNENAYSQGHTVTAKDIYDTCHLAWKSGCKTIYYIRSVQKDESIKVKAPKNECIVCAN